MIMDASNHAVSATISLFYHTLLIAIPDMWFRALVKTLSKNNPSSYKWHEMTFCFRWDLGRCVVLCIGIDPTFQSLLQDILRSMWPLLPPKEPFSMLVPLIEVIIALHDQSVWSIRDVIRRVEKVGIQCFVTLLSLTDSSFLRTVSVQKMGPTTLFGSTKPQDMPYIRLKLSVCRWKP